MGVYEDGREAAVASATASAPPTDRSALDWLLEPALEPAGLTETFTSSPSAAASGAERRRLVGSARERVAGGRVERWDKSEEHR